MCSYLPQVVVITAHQLHNQGASRVSYRLASMAQGWRRNKRGLRRHYTLSWYQILEMTKILKNSPGADFTRNHQQVRRLPGWMWKMMWIWFIACLQHTAPVGRLDTPTNPVVLLSFYYLKDSPRLKVMMVLSLLFLYWTASGYNLDHSIHCTPTLPPHTTADDLGHVEKARKSTKLTGDHLE